MKQFGGATIFFDRSDINTDEIIPAKYLTEITKLALKAHLLEDLLLDDKPFDPHSKELQNANVVVARENFGCGSSREHAVWAFEVNDINVIIAESFARIFRQNMFNCGILAIELPKPNIDKLFEISGDVTIDVDLERCEMTATQSGSATEKLVCSFELNSFDKDLVAAGGWLAYADKKY